MGCDLSRASRPAWPTARPTPPVKRIPPPPDPTHRGGGREGVVELLKDGAAPLRLPARPCVMKDTELGKT